MVGFGFEVFFFFFYTTSDGLAVQRIVIWVFWVLPCSVVLGWLCCGLRFGEALAMERHSDGEIEMRDRDKNIYIYIELHCSSIAKKFAIPGFTIP